MLEKDGWMNNDCSICIGAKQEANIVICAYDMTMNGEMGRPRIRD